MTMRTSEYPNNTHEQVERYIEDAALIVAGLELSDDLRGIAFAKAVDLLSSKQVVLEQVGLGMAIPQGKPH